MDLKRSKSPLPQDTMNNQKHKALLPAFQEGKKQFSSTFLPEVAFKAILQDT